MSDAAKVADLEDLSRFRATVIKALDELRLAISEAESEVGRVRGWVERDQHLYWQTQHRKAQEQVAICKSALFRKQMVTSSKDQKPSVVDEKKALERAQARLGLCEQKRAAVRKWAIQITREEILFKAGLSPLSAMVERELPHAVMLLTRMLEHLDAYTRLQAPDLSRLYEGGAEEVVEDMRRRGDSMKSLLRGAGSAESGDSAGCADPAAPSPSGGGGSGPEAPTGAAHRSAEPPPVSGAEGAPR